MHTAEKSAPKPSSFHIEIAIEMLEKYKSKCIDQIPARTNQSTR